MRPKTYFHGYRKLQEGSSLKGASIRVLLKITTTARPGIAPAKNIFFFKYSPVKHMDSSHCRIVIGHNFSVTPETTFYVK